MALEIFAYLDLPTIIACRLVCRYWNALAEDGYVWRTLFYREVDNKGWRVDERKARKSTTEDDLRRKRILSLSSVNSRSTSDSPSRTLKLAPLSVDWQKQYKTRAELDRRWLHEEPTTTRLTGHEDR